MHRSGRFAAVWFGAFIIISSFFGWVIGQPVWPLANKTVILGFSATLILSIATAWLLTRSRSATK